MGVAYARPDYFEPYTIYRTFGKDSQRTYPQSGLGGYHIGHRTPRTPSGSCIALSIVELTSWITAGTTTMVKASAAWGLRCAMASPPEGVPYVTKLDGRTKDATAR